MQLGEGENHIRYGLYEKGFVKPIEPHALRCMSYGGKVIFEHPGGLPSLLAPDMQAIEVPSVSNCLSA
jgi:hypothetical protein